MELSPSMMTQNHSSSSSSKNKKTGEALLRTEELLSLLNAALPEEIRVLDVQRTTRGFQAKTQRDRVRYRYMIPSFWLYERNALRTLMDQNIVYHPPGMDPSNTARWRIPTPPLQRVQDQLAPYRATAAQLEKLQMTLQQYLGTHSFHNFTRRCTAQEPRAKRYILNFEVEDPVLLSTPRRREDDDGTGTEEDMLTLEWIPTTVTGQSFLLNQIRKMIFAALEVTREAWPPQQLAEALHSRQSLPFRGLAPAQGLFLDMSFYDSYNTKIGRCDNMTPAPTLDWWEPDAPAHRRWKAFRDTVIVPHVAQEEMEQGNFLQYLYQLEHPAYFARAEEEEEEEEEENQDEEDLEEED
jgi:tRNA pseudouridine(38-40) synthase